MVNDFTVNGDTTVLHIESLKFGRFEALIDTEDLPKVQQINTWFASRNNVTGLFYVTGHVTKEGKKKTVYLHRLILGVQDPKEFIDHIYHDTMDNRKKSLRKVSNYENQQNARRNKANTSGITGVTWNKTGNRWQAQIRVNGKNLYLGLFDSLEEAGKARQAAEEKHWDYKNAVSETLLLEGEG